MITCSYCSYKNRPGALFCEDCGRSLQEGAPTTLPVPRSRRVGAMASSPQRNAYCGTETAVVVYIQDEEDPIVLYEFDRLTVGRVDPRSVHRPDVDLTPYGALEKGVSRMHAVLARFEDHLYITDIGSRNGVAINGERIERDVYARLYDGDEVTLANMVVHIYF